VQVLISAGEASGEMYGAQLIEALRRRFSGDGKTIGTPAEDLKFFGVGGGKMRAAGCEIVVNAKDLAVVGITEILSQLPKILDLYLHLIDQADKRKPDLAIVIDSPAFNWRVARQMKMRGIPVVYYVCPQFWAWRQGRVKLLQKYVDKALVIFPFELKFYRDRGVNAEFVGHPLGNVERPAITREDYAGVCNLDPAKQWITIMPGSRQKEVRLNFPTMLKAAAKLGTAFEFLVPVAATLERTFLESFLTFAGAVAGNIRFVPEALPALAHSRAGIIASGTATVEAALMGLPFVMVYRVNKLTYMLGRKRVKVPFFAMVNLIAGERVVPELVQNDFTPNAVVAHVKSIVADGPRRNEMLYGLRLVRAQLQGPRDSPNTPDRAAEAIQKFLAGRASAASF
jgi:lipid-A-disaccharide synthase